MSDPDMITASIFREYDIRGVFQKQLHAQSVKLIGYHLGLRIAGGRAVAVGYDARTHSPLLRDALISGLNAAGCCVFDMGLVPTPVNYFSQFVPIDGVRLDAGVMITGSHNPPEYNGFKITVGQRPFFGDEIVALGEAVRADTDRIIPDNVQCVTIDAKGAYIAYLIEAFGHLRGFSSRIVYDCGNGVAGTVLPQIFEGLGISAKGIYVDPDGTFPHHHPDPSEEQNLQAIKRMLDAQGDIAFAYDGDADRLAVLTHRRNIKGDQMALLYTIPMDQPTVIGEVKCSQVMYDELERRGAKAIMYKTGHSNLKVKIHQMDADMACEVSGHLFFNDRYFGFDDAIYATLRLLELIDQGIDLDAKLDHLPQVFATEEIKLEATDESKFAVVEALKRRLSTPPEGFPEIVGMIDVDGIRIRFRHGWALVRASNTTPVLVTRYEAIDEACAGVYRQCVEALVDEAKAHFSHVGDVWI
jgi:phosphomannomutase / phosphoglucomutase